MNIHVQIIPHNKQRYPTVGDWFFDTNGTLHIHVSKMQDSRHERLVAIHEIIEAVLCDEVGINEAEVTKFDVEFEEARSVGNTTEPGDVLQAPYYRQHQFATGIERMLAAELEVDWLAYEKEINSL